jgi:hypothetical protein
VTVYTAFEGTREEITARLIVRRVPDLNKTGVDAQGELFTAWRYHAAFTDSPFVLIQAEAQHRGHAIIEQAQEQPATGLVKNHARTQRQDHDTPNINRRSSSVDRD